MKISLLSISTKVLPSKKHRKTVEVMIPTLKATMMQLKASRQKISLLSPLETKRRYLKESTVKQKRSLNATIVHLSKISKSLREKI